MTGSQKNKLASLVGFVLIAVLVVGGMAWATVATFDLEKENVRREHLKNVLLAVSEIDSHIRGVLKSETSRPFTDYLKLHTAEPVAGWSEGGATEDVDLVVLRSPIRESGPAYEWVDLYFQAVEDGTWSTPQVAADGRDPEMLEWLQAVLPIRELEKRVRQATKRDEAVADSVDGLSSVRRNAQAARGGHSHRRPHEHFPPPAWRDYQRRRESRIAAQRESLPGDQCVPVRLVEEFLAGSPSDPLAPDRHLYVCTPPVAVGLSLDPMATFWIEPSDEIGRKLAFVRTGYEDDKLVRQGFIADWEKLKNELLSMIKPWFPEADLEPLPDELAVDLATSETAIASINVRLQVPESPGETSAAAWRNIRGVMYTTWGVAVAVLVLAAWGVRNLVALTERRMQFAYAVTHELRTPLTTFRLYADMLSAGLVPEDAKEEYLDTLNRESMRLSSLVEGVLEYARLENQKVRLKPVETDADALMASVADTLNKRCDSSGVDPRSESKVDGSRRLRIDVDAVNQILGVLIANACRHARDSDSPAVLVRLTGDDGRLHLDVIDSGPGIDRADARTIFKPFRRGRRAAAAAHGGIGLGLALARDWAQLVGGRLDLIARHHPQYGGAHFRLAIPVRIPE